MGRALAQPMAPSSSARSSARVVRCTHKTTVYVYVGRLHTTRRTRQRHVQGFIRYGAYPVARRVTCAWASNGQSPRVSFNATTPIRDRPQSSSGFSRLSAESSAPSVCTQQQQQHSTRHKARHDTTVQEAGQHHTHLLCQLGILVWLVCCQAPCAEQLLRRWVHACAVCIHTLSSEGRFQRNSEHEMGDRGAVVQLRASATHCW